MSSNHTRIKLIPCHRTNSSLNDTNSSVKAQNSSLNDVNSSFDSSNINMFAKLKNFTKYKRKPSGKKTDVTGVITHFSTSNNSENQCFTTDDNSGYYRGLSKLTSGQASRYSLAFFVPDICLASQAKHVSSTAPIHPSQGRTVYDGVTSQNKIAERQICGAVASKTESEPRHPIPIVFSRAYSVTLTQNLLGAIRHG